jgi:hypothetical protein
MSFSYDQLLLGPCVASFGEAAQGFPVPTYMPATGVPFTIDGIFDEAYKLVDETSDLPVVSVQPRLGVRLSDFPSGMRPQQADRVEIRGKVYAVREIRLDGKGEAGLLLTRD